MEINVLTRPVGLALLITLYGCASTGNAPDRSASRRVTPADFRGQPAPNATDPTTGLPPAPLVFADPISRSDARGGVDEGVITIAGSPTPPPAPSNPTPQAPTGAPDREGVVLDRIVGRINGKPVLASEFLEPLDARFSAEAASVMDAPDARARAQARQAWIKGARENIGFEVWGLVRDELLLSEFRSSMTEQQQQGVRYFLDQLREDRFLQLGGTEKTVESNLLSEGMTFDEHVKALGDKKIRDAQLDRVLSRQATVSRRDVEQYYAVHIDDYTKPSRAVLRVLRIPLSKPDQIADAEQRLAAGDPFDEVAFDLSDFAPLEDGDPIETANTRLKVLTEPYEETEFYALEPLNDAIQALKQGDVTPRIDGRVWVWWVRLEVLEEAHVVPLYDAQFEIEGKIEQARKTEAANRYFESLLEKSSTTNPDAMIRELTEFAIARYLPAPAGEASEGSR